MCIFSLLISTHCGAYLLLLLLFLNTHPALPSQQERRILEETVAPLTPRPSALPSPGRGGVSCAPEPRDPVVRSLADWERKQELLERHTVI